MEITYPIHIIKNTGETWIIDEIEAESLKNHMTFRMKLHEKHVIHYYDFNGKKTIKCDYIARDDNGKIITNENWPFKPNFNDRKNKYYKLLKNLKDKGLPIPGTGISKRRSSNYKFNLSENRNQIKHIEDYKDLIVAGKRKIIKRKKAIFDFDRPYRMEEKNWKSQRKKQWR